MNGASKLLLLTFLFLTTLSVSALFYKSFVTESYEQTYSEEYTSEALPSDEEL